MQPAAYSEAALRYFRSQWSTSTDARGEWVLPVPRRGGLPVVIEAPGFSPAIETLRTAAAPATVVLFNGATLRASVDRIDPGMIVTLRAEDSDGKDPAAEWLPQVLALPAVKSSLEWSSLRPGRYRVIGRDFDPLKFAAVAELGHVTLREGERGTLQLKLPPPARREGKTAVLFVPGKSPADLRALDAFATPGGGVADWVEHSLERSAGGTLVYLRTTELPGDILLLTPGDVIAPAAGQGAVTDAPAKTVISGRATIAVHLTSDSAEQPLPPAATARFSACGQAGSMRFGVAVSTKGDAEFPFATLCHALTLEYPPFEPFFVEPHLSSGEARSFGPFALKVGAVAEIHAVKDPGGSAASSWQRVSPATASWRIVRADSLDRWFTLATRGGNALLAVSAGFELMTELRERLCSFAQRP